VIPCRMGETYPREMRRVAAAFAPMLLLIGLACGRGVPVASTISDSTTPSESVEPSSSTSLVEMPQPEPSPSDQIPDVQGISGTVSNRSGDVIAGICISAGNSLHGQNELPPRHVDARTDASGSYVVPLLAGEHYQVEFWDCRSNAQYAPYATPSMLVVQVQHETRNIDAVLGPGAAIAGT